MSAHGASMGEVSANFGEESAPVDALDSVGQVDGHCNLGRGGPRDLKNNCLATCAAESQALGVRTPT